MCTSCVSTKKKKNIAAIQEVLARRYLTDVPLSATVTTGQIGSQH